jgi:hypothetical protein
MKNNFFFKLGRFFRNHPILSILLVAISFYLIFSDSKETVYRKKTCLNVLNIPKEKQISILPVQENKDYVRCYKDYTYFIAYQLPKEIEDIKKEVLEFNELQKKLNNVPLIKDKNQYKEVKINEFLKDNFEDSFSLTPKNSSVIDKKIYFLSTRFRIIQNENAIDYYEVSIDDYLTAQFFNPKIQNKFVNTRTSNFRRLMDWRYPFELNKTVLVLVYGSFQTAPNWYGKRNKFYVDDAIFLPISWTDELLVSNVIDYYSKTHKLDKNHLTKVFNEIKSR